MIDPVAAIYAFLAAQSGITDVVSTRIYAETANPPAPYTPSDGRALCFKVRPGALEHESGVLLLSVQFTVWGAASGSQTAEERIWELWRAVIDALDATGGATVRHCWPETTGETLYDPDTTWPYVFGSVRMAIDNS